MFAVQPYHKPRLATLQRDTNQLSIESHRRRLHLLETDQRCWTSKLSGPDMMLCGCAFGFRMVAVAAV
jgi:hypothetical protein